jgi:hypothetical protein
MAFCALLQISDGYIFVFALFPQGIDNEVPMAELTISQVSLCMHHIRLPARLFRLLTPSLVL